MNSYERTEGGGGGGRRPGSRKIYNPWGGQDLGGGNYEGVWLDLDSHEGWTFYQNKYGTDPRIEIVEEKGQQGDPPYKLPNPWQAYKNKLRQVLRMDQVPNMGVVIVGRGLEQYALKPVKDGYLGVWKIGDPKAIMSILDYRTSDKVLELGIGALGIYEEDPRNRWSGSFFDRLYEWTPVPGKSDLYFNVGNMRFQDYYYEYKYVPELGHTMLPTKERTPWSGMFHDN